MTVCTRIMQRPVPRAGSAPRYSLFLALCLAAAACSGGEEDASPSFAGGVTQREPTRVRTVPVGMREMVRTLSTTTNVESEKEISIFPRASGVVTEVRVEEGDVVEAGQVLAVLDQREAQVMLDEARIGLREAQQNVPLLGLAREEALERLERAKLTHEQARRDVERNERAGLISQQDLDRLKLTADQAARDEGALRISLDRAIEDEKMAQTAIDKADLVLRRQTLALDALEVRAPFSGVIASRTMKVGDTAGNSIAAFVLTDIDSLRAIFFRPQRELPMFRAAHGGAANGDSPSGVPIEIRAEAEALPGRDFRGEIALVSPTIDSASGSFRVTVALPQPPDAPPSERLLPGMLVRLSIVTERHADALVVPKRALRREAETSFMFLVEDGVAQRVQVREGFTNDSNVEIFPVVPGSVAAGDAVIVVGNRDLEQDSLVLAEGWEEEPGEASRLAAELSQGENAAADEPAAETDDESGSDAAASTEGADAGSTDDELGSDG